MDKRLSLVAASAWRNLFLLLDIIPFCTFKQNNGSNSGEQNCSIKHANWLVKQNLFQGLWSHPKPSGYHFHFFEGPLQRDLSQTWTSDNFRNSSMIRAKNLTIPWKAQQGKCSFTRKWMHFNHRLKPTFVTVCLSTENIGVMCKWTSKCTTILTSIFADKSYPMETNSFTFWRSTAFLRGVIPYCFCSLALNSCQILIALCRTTRI